MRRADISNTDSEAKQNLDNTLGNMVNSKQIKRSKNGIYALNSFDIKINLAKHYY